MPYKNEKTGIWHADFRPKGARGKRERPPLPVDNYKDAKDMEDDLKRQAKADRSEDTAEPKGRTVRKLFPQYHRWVTVNRAGSTAADVATAGNHIIAILGTTDAVNLSSGYVELYKESRQKQGAGNRTINKELSWLSGFCKWGRKNGIKIRKFDIERLPYKRPLPIVPSQEEAAKILGVFDNAKLSPRQQRHRAFIALLYLVGMRKDEVSQLTWPDIDEENRAVLIEGKGGKFRLEPLPPVVLEMLLAFRPDPPEGYVFVSRQGKPLYRINKTLKKVALQAGVKKRIYPHLLRHAFGAHHIDEETDLRVLQELFGHGDIEQTAWYSQVSMKAKRRASEKFAEKVDTVGQNPKDPESKS